MARIILIETSTALCSVGLSEDGVCTHHKESPEPRAHAAMTAPYIKDILDEAGLRVADCDAVCVSKGPGSYTGLRVGSSTAKGLAFGAGIPLIALGTLEILAAQGRAAQVSPSAIIPMIDARRMEVYTAVFSPSGEQLTPTVSTIVTADSFAAERAAGPILFIGDGALKCREVLYPQGDSFAGPHAWFLGECPRASSMAALAEAAFQAGRFEDTAYFEPFYLKDFVATLPSRKLF